MSIEQFEISIGSRIAQVPARQNLKAMQYQEARRAALEASKAKAGLETSEPKKVNGNAVLEELIVHEPIVQEVIDSIIELKDDQATGQATDEELHAEYNSEEPVKLTPEVLPAQYSEDTVTNDESESVTESVAEEVVDESELNDEIYIEEMLDISTSDEDIVLVHESTVIELDDDNFEIQEIQEENK